MIRVHPATATDDVPEDRRCAWSKSAWPSSRSRPRASSPWSGDGPRAAVRRARRGPGRRPRGARPAKIDDRQLLWIDVDERADADLERLVARRSTSSRGSCAAGSPDRRRPRVVRVPERVAFTLDAVEPNPNGDEGLVSQAASTWSPAATSSSPSTTARSLAIRELDEQLRGERDLGLLDAGALLTGLLDAVIAGYLARGRGRSSARSTSSTGRAPTAGATTTTFLDARRRASPPDRRSLRRSLTPNRDALVPLVRPGLRGPRRHRPDRGRASSIGSSGRSTPSRTPASCSSARSTSTSAGRPSARTT